MQDRVLALSLVHRQIWKYGCWFLIMKYIDFFQIHSYLWFRIFEVSLNDPDNISFLLFPIIWKAPFCLSSSSKFIHQVSISHVFSIHLSPSPEILEHYWSILYYTTQLHTHTHTHTHTLLELSFKIHRWESFLKPYSTKKYKKTKSTWWISFYM